jgi:hypothetical protein
MKAAAMTSNGIVAETHPVKKNSFFNCTIVQYQLLIVVWSLALGVEHDTGGLDSGGLDPDDMEEPTAGETHEKR